jgi:cysteine-rich repeat protein
MRIRAVDTIAKSRVEADMACLNLLKKVIALAIIITLLINTNKALAIPGQECASHAACGENEHCAFQCGDGIRDEGEECDDGNTVDGDGCSSDCKCELKEQCSPAPGWSCDIRLTYDAERSVEPAIAVDSKNNAHIVWIGVEDKSQMVTGYFNATGVNYTYESRYTLHSLYYMKISKDEKKLVNKTRIWPAGETGTYAELARPRIAVDFEGNPHIVVMHRKNISGSDNRWAVYIKLDRAGNVITSEGLYWKYQELGWSIDNLNPAIGVSPRGTTPVVATNIEVFFPEEWFREAVSKEAYREYYKALALTGMISTTGGLPGTLLGILVLEPYGWALYEEILRVYGTFYWDFIKIAKRENCTDCWRGWNWSDVARSPEIPRTNTDINILDRLSSPSIAIDEFERISIAYIEKDIETNKRYVKLYRDGTTLTLNNPDAQADSQPVYWLQSPGVDISPITGIPHLVWQGKDQRIYYSEGIEGLPNQNISRAVIGYAKPDIAVDSQGIVNVVWINTSKDTGADELFYRSLDKGVWSPSTQLTFHQCPTGRDVDKPDIAAFREPNGERAVHLVWQDLRDGNYEIYYKHTIPAEYTFIWVPFNWTSQAEFENAVNARADFFTDISPLAACKDKVKNIALDIGWVGYNCPEVVKIEEALTKNGEHPSPDEAIVAAKICADNYMRSLGPKQKYDVAIGLGGPAHVLEEGWEGAAFLGFNTVFAEATGYNASEDRLETPAHEIAHAYYICDEYDLSFWAHEAAMLSTTALPGCCPNLWNFDTCPIEKSGDIVWPKYSCDSTATCCGPPAFKAYSGTYTAKNTICTEPPFYSVMGSGVSNHRCGYGKSSYGWLEYSRLLSCKQKAEKLPKPLALAPSKIVSIGLRFDKEGKEKASIKDIWTYEGIYTRPSTAGYYLLQVLDKGNNLVESISLPVSYYIMTDPPVEINNSYASIELEYGDDWKTLRVVKNESTLLEQDIEQLLCNKNNACDAKENYYSCPEDCKSNAKDGICNPQKEDGCDLDCAPGLDDDCIGMIAAIISPANNTVFNKNTRSVELKAQTTIPGTCKYSNVSTSFENMTAFTDTGSTIHSTTLAVQEGKEYDYYARCSDAAGAQSAEQYVHFNVSVNRPPVLSRIKDVTALETDLIVIRANATDADSDTLSFNISDGKFTQNDSGVFSWQTDYYDAGLYKVNITVTDGNLTDWQIVNVLVKNLNRIPSLEKIEDIWASELDKIVITPNATDPDLGENLTFYMDLEKVGVEGKLDKFNWINNSFEWQTTLYDSGRYRATITVSDGYINISYSFKIFILNVNAPPKLEPVSKQILRAGEAYYYKVNASDIDYDILHFSDNTTLFEINPYTGEIAFTPTSLDIGNHTIAINVTDGEYWDSIVVEYEIRGS